MALPAATRSCSDGSGMAARFARLCALTCSAIFLDMILTAPICPVTTCLTSLTVEQPPLPTVLPNCHCPIVLFLVDDAVEEAVDISESRFVSRCESLLMSETLRFPVDSCGLLRACKDTLFSTGILCGICAGEETAGWAALSVWGADEDMFALASPGPKGCLRDAGRASSWYRAAIVVFQRVTRVRARVVEN